MPQVTLTIEADSVDWGPLVPACGSAPALQSGRVMLDGLCVCVVHLVWPDGPCAVVCQSAPRHAGPQD